jgi:hypothetical protein
MMFDFGFRCATRYGNDYWHVRFFGKREVLVFDFGDMIGSLIYKVSKRDGATTYFGAAAFLHRDELFIAVQVHRPRGKSGRIWVAADDLSTSA